jgi:predicted Rossmann-fold nucleotide-binding protein
MKVGIVGPNKIFDGDLEERKKLLDSVAKIVADSKNEIVLTPDKDSLLEYFGKKYLKFGGEKISTVAPIEDKAEEHLNLELGEIINCHDWDRQANEFNRECDVFVCIGWAWGALKEIACAQYFNKKKIYILKEFISDKLPEELNFLVEYISISEVAEKLNELVEE